MFVFQACYGTNRDFGADVPIHGYVKSRTTNQPNPGINIASVLIDGSISACPNINRHFVQGNIYSDRFLDIWDNKFELMRNRIWTKTGVCLNCKDYKNCNGGAMHLWNENQDCIMICLNNELK